MTYLDQSARSSGPEVRSSRAPGEAAVIATSVVAACATWALWVDAAGVDLEVHAGDGVRTVGIAAVALTAGIVALAGSLLARLFARSVQGLHWWTVLAGGLWLLSMLGPLGATSVTGGLGLASLHLVVGATVILGVRRVHADRACGRA